MIRPHGRPPRRPRRTLGLRARLLAMSIVVVTAGLLGAQAYNAPALERDLGVHAREELATRVALAATAVRVAGPFDPARADALVREIAAAAGARVTLIDPAGVVAADSAVPRAALGALANHAGRPEVRAARAAGFGVAERRSDTVGEALTYAAMRVGEPAPGAAPWVVRVAVSPRLVATARATTRRFLWIGALVGLCAAAAMAWWAAELIARPVRDLTATARAMVRDLSVRTHRQDGDELGALATALDGLADNLEVSLASRERERDRLGAILEAMAEGVLVTDARGTILLANRALREMFLVGRDVVGRSPIEAVRNVELHEVIAEALGTGSSVEREIAVGGVRPRRVMARVALVEEPGATAGAAPGAGPVRGVVAVLSDVTDLRRLEAVRRDFVANVSHELRTPVAAIRAAAETLLGGALAEPAAAREFVGIVDRHADRLHRLVEDLLELSRLEARELQLAPQPVAVGAAVDRAIDLFALAVKARRTRLVADVAPDIAPADADPQALEQVLSNLIDNAIKYSPEGATVTVRARPAPATPATPATLGGHRVRISVEDTGPGIEAKHLPRIFERFYRVDASRSRHLGGTGLGLAIVKHLSEAMGARVSVESVVGRGTTFHVDLRAGEGDGQGDGQGDD